MAPAPLTQLTDETFTAQVEQAGVIAMVEFWAAWCAPCRMLEPVVRQLAGDFGKQAVVAQLDTDKHPDTAGRFDVTAVPTIILFKDGQPMHRFVGLTGYDKLASALESLASPAAEPTSQPAGQQTAE